MERIRIENPIWNEHSVGLVYYKLNEDIEVSIETLNKKGLRIFPNVYIFRSKNKDKYKTYTSTSGFSTKLIIVPIKDLEKTNKYNLIWE